MCVCVIDVSVYCESQPREMGKPPQPKTVFFCFVLTSHSLAPLPTLL